MRYLFLVVLLAGCHDSDWLSYGWDDRRVMCSQAVDDLSASVDLHSVDDAFAYAEHTNAVALFHAHVPGVTVSRGMIDWMLSNAEAHHMDFVGYDELVPGQEPRPGLAFAFDDQAVDAWMATRDLFAAHGARVTFFVTRFENYTDDMKAELVQLAADGHDIEAHSVNHLHAGSYVHEHGLDGYIADEVQPSIDILRTTGYAPTAYAFPFGEASETTWNRVLELDGIGRVRVSPRDCPY
jgi:peptidoglycan/xylan/chitin deacetylase (PgdA/CDA1 family)